MILAGTALRTYIVSELQSVLSPVPIYSVMPPDNVLKYVIVTGLGENDASPKNCFLTDGFIQIQVVEKFDKRDGDLDWVNTIASLISRTLCPTRQSKIGDENGVNVFYIYIDSNAEALFDTDPGRTAVSSLRLRYMAQEGTPIT
jgi:hypothetical protein